MECLYLPKNEVCEKLRLIADFVEVADLKGQNVVDMLSSDWKGYAGEVQLVVSALSFVNTIYLGRKYKYPMNEVCEKLRLIADFVEVADLKGQNVVDMLSSDWNRFERAKCC